MLPRSLAVRVYTYVTWRHEGNGFWKWKCGPERGKVLALCGLSIRFLSYIFLLCSLLPEPTFLHRCRTHSDSKYLQNPWRHHLYLHHRKTRRRQWKTKMFQSGHVDQGAFWSGVRRLDFPQKNKKKKTKKKTLAEVAVVLLYRWADAHLCQLSQTISKHCRIGKRRACCY